LLNQTQLPYRPVTFANLMSVSYPLGSFEYNSLSDPGMHCGAMQLVPILTRIL
jgi:hypothetical protein